MQLTPVLIYSGALFLVTIIVASTYRLQAKKDQKPTSLANKATFLAGIFLFGLLFFYLESMAIYYWSPDPGNPGKEIFEAAKTIAPPATTLIIGYYFGQKK